MWCLLKVLLSHFPTCGVKWCFIHRTWLHSMETLLSRFQEELARNCTALPRCVFSLWFDIDELTCVMWRARLRDVPAWCDKLTCVMVTSSPAWCDLHDVTSSPAWCDELTCVMYLRDVMSSPAWWWRAHLRDETFMMWRAHLHDVTSSPAWCDELTCVMWRAHLHDVTSSPAWCVMHLWPVSHCSVETVSRVSVVKQQFLV